MTPDAPTYLVYAPSYDPDDGGGLVLHRFVHALRGLGEQAFLVPMQAVFRQGVLDRMKARLRANPYRTAPGLDTPVWPDGALPEGAVVVYSEIIPGNPLGARNVVRWLLHRPGFHFGTHDFGADELFFKWADFCDAPEITGGPAHPLTLFTIPEVYTTTNTGPRQGACYLVRKGHKKDIVHYRSDAIRIDGKDHAEIARIFNRCESFHSYDEDTMYSLFAVLCGCDSVVVPGRYGARADWVADHALFRYGIAYGDDDLEHARATASLVPGLLAGLTAERDASVHDFIRITRAHFGHDVPDMG